MTHFCSRSQNLCDKAESAVGLSSRQFDVKKHTQRNNFQCTKKKYFKLQQRNMAVNNSSRGFLEKSCTIFTLKFLSTNSACIFTRKQFFFHYLLHGNKKSLSKLSSCDSKHVPCAVVSYTIYSIKNIYTCKMCHQMDQCLQL